MRNVPFAAYVTTSQHDTPGPSSRIVQVRGRVGVYQSVDAALRDEHYVIQLCHQYNRPIDLVCCLNVETVLRFNEHGRISHRKAADTITGPKERS